MTHERDHIIRQKEQIDNVDYESKLKEVGIRVTSVRLLVYKTVYNQMHYAFSLQDVMEKLPYADNSSVFRALSTFAEHHLLHMIDDGSGMQKYCVCRCGQFKCHHAHLTCTVCHETICLKDVPLPVIDIPDDFVVEEAEYIVKGICPRCQRNRHR